MSKAPPDTPPPKIEINEGTSIPLKSDRVLFTAWELSLGLAIITLVVLCWRRPDPYWNIVKFLPDGIWVTVQVTLYTLPCALVTGLLAGLGRVSPVRGINLVASMYVEIVRGVPLLVQLFYIYYALAKFFTLPDIVSAVIALSFCYGAYLAEAIRAGIESVDKGQVEASRSLGFSSGQTMRWVVLPQAWRTILPPVGNEFIALLKDSSLVSVISVADMMRRGREYAATSFEYFETYTVIALVYLIMTLLLSRGVGILEERYGRHTR